MSLPTRLKFGLSLAAACASLVCTAPAAAEPTLFVPYAGSGNLVLFDAATGSGGWVGSIEQFPDPEVAAPLSLVSVVLFNVDALSRTLSGTFAFTSAADLGGSLFGTLFGSTAETDIFATGGQFSIDYAITGGTGFYAGATGFGLAFLNYDPAGAFNNYSENGLLNIGMVPEPDTLTLLLAGGVSLALAMSLRRARQRRDRQIRARA